MKTASDKILTYEQVGETIQKLKKEEKTIVFTNGCFDLLHKGHIYYLEEAASLGDALIVGVNSDASVKRLKGEDRPVKDEDTRALCLAAMQHIHYVIIFEEDTPLWLIKEINPDILVKGGDWSADQIVGSDHVLSYGGKVQSLSFHDGESSTQLIDKMKS